ncbi:MULTISPECIES: LysR family transcriptional regulator [unclassified Crossiella]|uniref:LysR family transcriptional regulator n=1 Tax=unclassified Crossiella TaxID=2620835 RepID=UPI001FFFE81A|nr:MULTISPECIES: LysR family transcriptional regulator [unclassified Crossiella]MCK2239471.1 LysR family transcriptional regulator [Crossiella sp. S99.2]MCK2252166.1 LysR family transcriptional regulator [Crossiella sp. S99.1]
MLDLRRLRMLRALADHGTVTAAADALYVTPSAVSQHLAALETEVGQPLLERRGRRVRLTAAGELLLSHTNTILAELERAEAALAAHASGQNGEIVVAAFASAIGLLVAPTIAALRERAPGVLVRVRDAEGHESLPMLMDGGVDLAVAVEYRGAPREDDERVARVALYAEPFDAVLSAAHPLAQAAEVPLAELAGEDWISPSPGNPVYDVVRLACEHAGITPRIAHYSADFRATAALAGAGAGVALVPRTALYGVRLTGAVTRPLVAPAPVRRVFAAIRRGAETRPLVQATLAELRRTAEGLG